MRETYIQTNIRCYCMNAVTCDENEDLRTHQINTTLPRKEIANIKQVLRRWFGCDVPPLAIL